MIVVAINYRLGPLGFLCLDTDEGAGNMGMLDQGPNSIDINAGP